MIKGLMTGMLFGSAALANPELTTFGAETHNEINYEVNSRIEVLSSYYGAISKSQHGQYLDAEASDNIQPGDMLIMIVATSGGDQDHIPPQFQKVINAIKDNGDLTLRVGYKIHKEGDDVFFRIPKKSRNFFVSLLTIRGATKIVAAKGMIDSASGSRGLSYAPKIRTAEQGAIISSFCYDDPFQADVVNQKTLVSLRNGDDGLAVGIGSTDGGLSRRIKAYDGQKQRGGGDDIAVAISIH
jgi:hypothetical protein